MAFSYKWMSIFCFFLCLSHNSYPRSQHNTILYSLKVNSMHASKGQEIMTVSLPAWAGQILIYHCLFEVVLNKISKYSASAVDVPCASLDSYEYMKSCKYFSICIFLTQIEKHENIWLTVGTIRFTSYFFIFVYYLFIFWCKRKILMLKVNIQSLFMVHTVVAKIKIAAV